MRPMPNLMNGEGQGAALFSYIVPWNYPDVVRKFIGNVSDEEVHRVPQIGNSPTFVSVKDFRVLAPIWYNTTLDVYEDKEANDAWNWVLEMYAYSLSTYRAGQHADMKVWGGIGDKIHTSGRRQCQLWSGVSCLRGEKHLLGGGPRAYGFGRVPGLRCR